MSESNETPNKTPQDLPSSSSSLKKKPSKEINNHGGSHSGHKKPYTNPPDPMNPDAATLREQWRYAIRQYSKWYSHAWGTAILAGISFFALGWIIKGSNPLPSKSDSGSVADQSSSPNRRDETN